eukprot:286828_1
MATIFLLVWLLPAMQLHAQLFSTSNNDLAEQAITCSESSCEVQCDSSFGCKNTTINASLSQSFFLSCTGNDSCTGLSITSGAQLFTEIHCSSIRSCESAVFTVSSSPNVILNCNAPNLTSGTGNNGSCLNTVVHAENSVNVNVNCIGDYNCNDIQIDATNVEIALNLNCDG